MFPPWVCVCGFFLLSSLSVSCPPLLPSSSSCNKQHEGGCNWEVQGSARWNHLYLNAGFRSLSRSLLYIVSLPLVLLLYTLFLLSYILALTCPPHYVYRSDCLINVMWQDVTAVLSLVSTVFLSAVCLRQCSPPPQLGPTPKAFPLKDAVPSFSSLSSCLPSVFQDDSITMKSFEF